MFSNHGHGSRGGKWATLVPAGKCAREAGPKPRRRQGSEADSSPGSPRPAGRGQVRRLPHPPAPSRTRAQVRPAPRCPPGGDPERVATGLRRLPSLGEGSYSPWRFTASPGPGRLPSPGQRQPAREEKGELEAGGASLASPREGLCGRCARSQRANRRTGERLAPAAAAAAPEQPPQAPSAPRSRPGLDCLAGSPNGDLWRPPVEWQLRGEKSCLWDHRKGWEMTGLRGLPALRKRH
uniref:uncharacterized protein LOC128932251 n=1 Tax=Callithrix jacchus TaxID=9483 RepID=UPI0023DD3923|nr:uncharacterized protein LOC128932251 [Callithrix jacchus]